ncbi:MAG TPA: methyltransferase domain-containing protein [Solirubrobacteraceae bacterium]|nr:methyltransferase domain-containing protein [Solirubrobacteraceae bacterium]
MPRNQDMQLETPPARTPAEDGSAAAAAAVEIQSLGLVYVPAEEGDGPMVPLTYAVLRDGTTFLVDLAQIGAGATSTPLREVPERARAAIRAEHRGADLTFPSLVRDHRIGHALPGRADEVLWVDPMKIDLVYGGTAGRTLTRLEGAVLGGDWDAVHKRRFGALHVTRAIHERILRGTPWEETTFYAGIVRQIEKGVHKWSCRSEEEFAQRLAGIDRLIESIRSAGYKTQEELGLRPAWDEIRVAIQRDGRFLFLDGRHRLAIARALGLPEVPVRVCVRHLEWERLKDDIHEYASRRKGRVYQLIDHPDLRDVPAHHGTERAVILTRALGDYDARGKRLLDIGAHWGYMTQQFERLGFRCTAVEANKTCARIAGKLAVATESSYDVWRGDVFEFPDAEEYDVVLALSIFHHFIKTEELHAKLVAFLGRLSADVILFEPHVSDPPGQMRGAYRNYHPQEFADFVARHAGMSRTEHLGLAPDGRSLFKLVR